MLLHPPSPSFCRASVFNERAYPDDIVCRLACAHSFFHSTYPLDWSWFSFIPSFTPLLHPLPTPLTLSPLVVPCPVIAQSGCVGGHRRGSGQAASPLPPPLPLRSCSSAQVGLHGISILLHVVSPRFLGSGSIVCGGGGEGGGEASFRAAVWQLDGAGKQCFPRSRRGL